MTTCIGHVALPAPDIEASRAFWAKLGFVDRYTKRATDGRLLLHQMESGTAIVELFPVGPYEDQNAPAPRHVGLRVPSAQAFWETCRAAALDPLDRPARGETGVDYFFLRDPAGNWIEIVSG